MKCPHCGKDIFNGNANKNSSKTKREQARELLLQGILEGMVSHYSKANYGTDEAQRPVKEKQF